MPPAQAACSAAIWRQGCRCLLLLPLFPALLLLLAQKQTAALLDTLPPLLRKCPAALLKCSKASSRMARQRLPSCWRNATVRMGGLLMLFTAAGCQGAPPAQ